MNERIIAHSSEILMTFKDWSLKTNQCHLSLTLFLPNDTLTIH